MKSRFEDNPNNIISYRKLPETNDQLQQFFKYKSPLNHMSVMFKKSKVVEAGGYLHFYLLEDYWLWVRMIKNGANLYNIQDVLVNVRGGRSMSARRGGWKYAKSEIKLQQEFLRLGLISYFDFIKNVAIRFTVRIMPNKMRTFVYKKLLRK